MIYVTLFRNIFYLITNNPNKQNNHFATAHCDFSVDQQIRLFTLCGQKMGK